MRRFRDKHMMAAVCSSCGAESEVFAISIPGEKAKSEIEIASALGRQQWAQADDGRFIWCPGCKGMPR